MRKIELNLPYEMGDKIPKSDGKYYTVKGIHIYCGKKNRCLTARYYVGNHTFITIKL